MATGIENRQQLRAELAKLRAEAELQEQKIKLNFERVQEDLKPENILRNSFSRLTGIHLKGKGLFNDALKFGLSALLQRFIIKTERKVEEKVWDLISAAAQRFKDLFKKKDKEENPEDESL
jgi:hypothetical protein